MLQINILVSTSFFRSFVYSHNWNECVSFRLPSAPLSTTAIQYKITPRFCRLKLTSLSNVINCSQMSTIRHTLLYIYYHHPVPENTAQMLLTICKTPIHNSICRLSWRVYIFFFFWCQPEATVKKVRRKTNSAITATMVGKKKTPPLEKSADPSGTVVGEEKKIKEVGGACELSCCRKDWYFENWRSCFWVKF